MAAGDRTKARLVDGYSSEMRAGDFYFVDQADGSVWGLNHVCPRCGHLGGMKFGDAGAWSWNGNREAPTCTPSILHSKETCGWHGFLTAGEFIEI